MRPAEFSPESIIEAGQALQAVGRNITGFALRQKVGGGNPARLKQIWDEHAAGQVVAAIEPVAELPVEVADEVSAVAKALADRLAALAVELNDKAVKAAERRVHEVVRSAGEQREQAERELADAGATVEDLEGKLDAADATTAELRGELAEALESGQAQAVELATLKERLSLIEHAGKTAAEQYAADLGRVSASLTATAADRDQARAVAQEAQGEARELMRRTQEQGAALDALRAKLADAELAAARLEGERDRARQDADDAERRAVAVEIQAARTAEALEAAQAAQASAEKASAALRLEIATLAERAAHVADLRAIVATLQAQARPALLLEPTAAPTGVAPEAVKKAPARRRARSDA
jgi:chromosome segregation ATPase